MDLLDECVDLVQSMLNKFKGPLRLITIPYRPFGVVVFALILLSRILAASLICCGQVVRRQHVLDQTGVLAVRRVFFQESLVSHKLRFEA